MLLIHPLKLAVPISKRLSDKMSATKKQKQAKEYFPGQAAIEYKGSDSIDPMAFKYYNAEEVVAGTVSYTHLTLPTN